MMFVKVVVIRKTKENKGKRREEITELNLGKGRVGKGLFNNDGKTLTGSLKLEGFAKLRKLIISSHQITELDVSECSKLEDLDCGNNRLDSLNVTGCFKLKKIDCSSNNYLEEVDVSNCLELTQVGSGFSHNSEKSRLVRDLAKAKNNGSQIVFAKDNDVRNILVFGMTGGGKSTLANVLTGTGNFEEKDSSTSVTERFQKSTVFVWRGKKYCVIDNIGFGDTSNLSERDILFKIGEGIHAAKEGINQALFVVSGRFAPDQIKAFNKFKNFVAESRITEFTTLVKTGFKDFQSEEGCKADLEKLTSESQELNEIVDSCKGFVYVDNKPMPEIDEEDSDNEKEIQISEGKRKKSREIVLEHLTKECQQIYKLKGWDDISSRVDEYINKEKEIEQSSVSKSEKEKAIEKEKELLAEDLRLRLEFSPATLQAVVEIEAKGLSCSIL